MSNQYYAGTHFDDNIVVGNSNVDSTYYYVGENTTGAAPTDNFTGATGTNSVNVAIMPDAASDYTITTSGGVTTLVSGDPAHAGTLNLTDVQAVAFDPAVDPGANTGALTASGDGLYVFGQLPGVSEPITIDTGATLVLATADSANITFNGFGIFELTQSVDTAAISGYSDAAVLDLKGVNFGSGTTVTPNGGDTQLTVTDGTNTADINIAGTSYNTAWYVLSDGHSNGSGGDGTLVIDPNLVIGSGGSHNFTGASADMVLFTNATGDTGSLVIGGRIRL